MHCRFFSEHLLNAYQLINEGQANIPRPLQIVKSSIQFMNDPIVLLGDVLCHWQPIMFLSMFCIKYQMRAPLKDFLQQFLFPSIPIEVLKSQAEVLHQLSGEYQIESVLPWRSFDTIKTICNKLDHNNDCTRVAGNEAVQHQDFGSYSTLGEEYMHTSTCTIFQIFELKMSKAFITAI